MLAKQNNVIPFHTTALVAGNDQAPRVLDPQKAAVARKRLQFVNAATAQMEEQGWSLSRSCEYIFHTAQHPDSALHAIGLSLGKGGKMIGKTQIKRWVQAFQQKGISGLMDNRKGKRRVEYGWELRAMHLYAKPQKPSVQFVVEALWREGFNGVTYDRVGRYLKSLPTDLTTYSEGRLGKKKAASTARAYVHRDTSVLPVGYLYQGDGHRCDVYIAHPNTGKIFRPELTLWMDVRSRYVVGWFLSEDEDSHSTLYALSHAMLSHDHVPAEVHIDNGCGYKSKLMSDESTGFYERFSIKPMFAHAYNAKAKGQVERFFRTFEGKLGKQFDTYCGADMSEETLQKVVRGVKKGTYTLPSMAQYRDAITSWLEEYHHTPHSGLDGKTPAELWEQLEQVKVEVPDAVVMLPSVTRTVSTRSTLTLHNRTYTHPELIHHQREKVKVQYSIHSDAMVRVTTLKDQWLCDAELVHKEAYVPESRIEENRQRRLKGQAKRLHQHLEEKKQRAGLLIGHEETLNGYEQLGVDLALERGSETDGEASISLELPWDQGQPHEDDVVIDLNVSWQPN